MLVGNDLSKPHAANISCDTGRICFTETNNFAVDFDVFDVSRRTQQCLCKVTSSDTVTVPPGQSAYIIADYKALPADRCFFFDAEHLAAFNAVVDTKTPHMVPITNTSFQSVTIKRKDRLGSIHEITDGSLFVNS
ncbi:uncharacterized protein B0I36DRAFT_370394 [Microdochium trichocladiopsis]|uniref:Uncharacterized protein n=1 Tax=Microdochium trichocladiopsis TaxID=1682393 RepID=A0A9P9BKJ2_9PEZI|nr:uncharacterized protein B0I36DRAFT_370394 [Microdochium trichocladiopsis]KAH7009466.1 hypothetical protein B0I36DRAFT_370394 [Microdochium trichocladiopsis]